MNNTVKCPHCNKIYFDLKNDNICPFCRKNINVFLDRFKDLFGEDNPFKDILGE